MSNSIARGRRQQRRPHGRLSQEGAMPKLSITLTPRTVKQVDAYAEMLCWTRSAVIELVLDRELNHVMDRALEVIGRKVSHE